MSETQRDEAPRCHDCGCELKGRCWRARRPNGSWYEVDHFAKTEKGRRRVHSVLFLCAQCNERVQ